jgi:imidazolonepropionase-like amidohydrolase
VPLILSVTAELTACSGCRSIEHASFIDEEGIAACLSHGTWIVPTFLIGRSVGCSRCSSPQTGEYYSDHGSSTGAQDRMIALQSLTNERYRRCISEAIRRGVRVALGSDFVGWDPKITGPPSSPSPSSPPTPSSAREFFYLVEYGGMSPLDAIYAGTSSAADLLQIPSIGRIQTGCVADLVVVQGDPLEDISLLETGVVWVMKGGKVVRSDLPRGADSQPPPQR